jgi:hypothetical protein
MEIGSDFVQPFDDVQDGILFITAGVFANVSGKEAWRLK